jgi:hypothetical protein
LGFYRGRFTRIFLGEAGHIPSNPREMTDTETIAKQQKEIEKLQRKIKRLEKRLLDKKKYETEDLLQRGATPQFIENINQKDQAALRNE